LNGIKGEGKFAVVDDKHFAELSKYKWWLNSKGYVVAITRTESGAKFVRMHRIVMSAPNNLQVDHIDRNKLRNTVDNLRLCKNGENIRSRGLRRDNTSGFVGVSFDKGYSKWQAYIKVNNRRLFLGYFDNKEDAARAHNIAALKYHGEYAYLNPVSIEA